MKWSKFILNFLISLLLLFSLIILQLSFFTRGVLLNAKFYENSLLKTDYYSNLKAQIEEGFKHLSLMTSVPEDIFKGTITESYLKSQSYKSIESALEYMKGNVKELNNNLDTSEIENNLNKNIKEYAQKKGLKLTAQNTKEIEKISKDAGNLINNHGNLLNLKSLTNSNKFLQFRFILQKLYLNTVVIALVNIILILLLLAINFKNINTYIEWTSFSMISSSFFTAFPPALLYFSNKFNNLAVANQYLKEGLISILKGASKYLMINGLILFFIGVLLLILSSIFIKGKKQDAN